MVTREEIENLIAIATIESIIVRVKYDLQDFEFNAKPIGDRQQKQEYINNFKTKILGKMATLKYFEMSGKDGSNIPQQPILLTIRDYE